MVEACSLDFRCQQTWTACDRVGPPWSQSAEGQLPLGTDRRCQGTNRSQRLSRARVPFNGAPMPSHALVRRSLVAASLLLAVATSLPAQLITPKTVPIHQGEQFGIYPSQWPSMGGVSIALVDTIGDPWANPAKATRLTSGSLQVMPFTHHATAGGGRTLPVSILQTGGSYAGGALFSMQEVERRNAAWNAPLSERRASNQ